MTRKEAEKSLILQGCEIISKDEKQTIFGTANKRDCIAVMDDVIHIGISGGDFYFVAKLEDMKANIFCNFEITGKMMGRYL